MGIFDKKLVSRKVKIKNRNFFNFYGNSEVYIIWMILLILELIIDDCRKYYIFLNNLIIENFKIFLGCC